MFAKSADDGLNMSKVTERILKELEEICDIEGDGFRKGSERRKIEIRKWVEKTIQEIETDIPIVNKKYLTSENKDVIIYKLAQEIAEQLIEEGIVKVENSDKLIKTKVTVVK